MNDPNEHSETVDYQAANDDDGAAAGDVKLNADNEASSDSSLPTAIGRYRILKTLGEGSFGRVYLAHDDELDRSVAIKVPRRERLTELADVEQYLTEARTLARLEHANIVPVYDVGRTDDGLCFVVSKYVEGTDLAERIKEARPSNSEAAELIVAVAEALHYAHTQGFVHRDIKPANILLDTAGRSFVADFGLALKEADFGKGSGWAGTPAYMSPEQARGEGHRVDGRSDIFSLGVVFYELLTGKRPFRGAAPNELLNQIVSIEARPPRQIDDRIPKELERICLKALSKRATDRYTTARDMAEDVRHFLADQPAVAETSTTSAAEKQSEPDSTQVPADANKGASDSQHISIVPKGLRSFDEHDADFFLELLPGPRDRDGLPDSIRFWKTRIEELDADKAFSVGLIYGSSGCGKSSLVKAGLLPRISDDVITVYVEATTEETETRLLNGLRKRCHGLEDNLSLKEALTALRRGEGIPTDQKVLIVLDQFEQWLHAKKEEENTELVQALRQCDGGRVQCVVMVRDDFWMAVTRFLRELEVRLVEDHNLAAVDLFPERHAQKVLAAFGRAFGTLPDDISQTTKEQKDFLKQSTAGLAEEGKVICVRLALFAEMMKGKEWTPATLKDVGGTKGIGVTFFEETFSSSTASPEHRYHQKAARAVLKALLPESSTNIKGHMRSYAELLEASGYGSRPEDFDDLIRILDSEIRLITPTDPEGKDPDDESVTQTEAGQKYFQLTHDYLVHSLRDWLTRKQKETRRGRSELRLFDQSLTWNAKPENRHLPSLWEYGNIRLLTDKKNWSEPQRKMIRKSGRIHAVRWGASLALLLVVGIAIQQYVASVRNRNLVERLEQAVESLGNSPWYKVSDAIADLREFPRDMVVARLKERFAGAKSGQKLALACALADYGEVELEFLLSSIGVAPANECVNIAAALDNASVSALKGLANEADANADWKLKARLAVVALHLGDASIAVDVNKDRPDPTQQIVFIHDVCPTWHGDLKQLAEQVKDLEDGSLRAGLALAMGNLPADAVTESQSALQDLMTKWYLKSPDSGTHSAAGWALRQWNVDLPEITPDATDPSYRNWKVTPHGFTLVRVPAGQFERTDGTTKQAVTLTRDLWLSDREVTVELFRQFMDDKSYQGLKPKAWGGDKRTSPTKQHPAQDVSWQDAVVFCNWLSHREGRLPCYKVEPLADVTPYKHAWRVELLQDGTGYRLPTEAEWEYACRAGTTTDFGFGNDAKRSEQYAVFRASKTEVPASKMCNRWGLFDIHGNVREWCHDRKGAYADEKAEDPHGSLNGLSRVCRGGAFNNFATSCPSGDREWNDPGGRFLGFGFRVAQVPLPVKKPASAAKSESR